MTVIYLDVLFLLNLTVDYLLLLATARIAGEPFSRLRLGTGALLGGAYAALIFLPWFAWCAHPAFKLCVGVGMAMLAFGVSRRLLRLTLVFFALSAALGGIVLALQLLETGGLTLENGVLYTGFDLRLLLVTVLLSYGVLCLIFRNTARHGGTKKDLCATRLMFGEKVIPINVLLDTGNTLSDPIRNQPVLVVEGRVLQEISPSGVNLADPIGTMEHLEDTWWKKRCCLLPYRAVGVEHGMLLAVRSDRVVINDRCWNSLLVALSPTPVSDGGGYQGLFGDHVGGKE